MVFSFGSFYVVKTRDTDTLDSFGRERTRVRGIPAAMAPAPIAGNVVSIASRAAAGLLDR